MLLGKAGHVKAGIEFILLQFGQNFHKTKTKCLFSKSRESGVCNDDGVRHFPRSICALLQDLAVSVGCILPPFWQLQWSNNAISHFMGVVPLWCKRQVYPIL